MNIKRTRQDTPTSGSRFGPGRLAELATRRPRRVLAAWGLVVLVSFGLIGALLGSALTSEQSLTNNPESDKAQKLIDARMPGQNKVDEVIVVRSEQLTVSEPAFETRVRTLADDIRGAGGVKQVSSYLDPGGEILVSADKHATLLPVVLADPGEDQIEHVVTVVERADGTDGFATHMTGAFTLDRDFTEVSERT